MRLAHSDKATTQTLSFIYAAVWQRAHSLGQRSKWRSGSCPVCPCQPWASACHRNSPFCFFSPVWSRCASVLCFSFPTPFASSDSSFPRPPTARARTRTRTRRRPRAARSSSSRKRRARTGSARSASGAPRLNPSRTSSSESAANHP